MNVKRTMNINSAYRVAVGIVVVMEYQENDTFTE